MMHEMRDPVRDDTGFAAACAGEDQQRTVDVRSGIALLGIQTGKEIHQVSSSGDILILANQGREVIR